MWSATRPTFQGEKNHSSAPWETSFLEKTKREPPPISLDATTTTWEIVPSCRPFGEH